MNWIKAELEAIPGDLRRALSRYEHGADATLVIDGRTILNFTSNNYLSLASHPQVVEAGCRALWDFGAGAGSSRLITGTSPLVISLEEETAALKGASAALVTTSGFAAALASIPVLADSADGIAIDHGAHASLVTAARLSEARLAVFRRQKAASLETAVANLRRHGVRRVLIIVDGLHSMDGDIAPLDEIVPIAENFDAMLLVDDAHATGVLGPRGEGTLAHFAIPVADRIIQIGNYAKAFGSQGGFVAASRSVIDLITQRSAAFIYTTGTAPVLAGIAREALRVLALEPVHLERLRENVIALRESIGGSAIVDTTPVIPIIVGSSEDTLALSRDLFSRGALVSAIRPPTVPRGTARLRISVQAGHRLSRAVGSGKILVERPDHSPEEGYLALLRRAAAEKIANAS